MKFELEQVEKPIRKLRKQLDAFPANPRPEDVHTLRTHARRLEATVAALLSERQKQSRRLIKLVTPIRKAAGKVRDMDVLLADLLTLPGNHAGDSLIRLVEHLSQMRLKSARKLRDTVRRQSEKSRRTLKQSARLFRKKLKDETVAAHGGAALQILMTELSRWPDLDASNLHQFRIRIKELRYTLQLAREPDAKLVDRLGEVKDAIGEWHDWVELLKISGEILDPVQDRRILKQIKKIGSEKFEVALAAANELRERYFTSSPSDRTRRRVLQMAAAS